MPVRLSGSFRPQSTAPCPRLSRLLQRAARGLGRVAVHTHSSPRPGTSVPLGPARAPERPGDAGHPQGTAAPPAGRALGAEQASADAQAACKTKGPRAPGWRGEEGCGRGGRSGGAVCASGPEGRGAVSTWLGRGDGHQGRASVSAGRWARGGTHRGHRAREGPGRHCWTGLGSARRWDRPLREWTVVLSPVQSPVMGGMTQTWRAVTQAPPTRLPAWKGTRGVGRSGLLGLARGARPRPPAQQGQRVLPPCSAATSSGPMGETTAPSPLGTRRRCPKPALPEARVPTCRAGCAGQGLGSPSCTRLLYVVLRTRSSAHRT